MKRGKLKVHITLESEVKPAMERSAAKVLGTLNSIINHAVQVRFPEYDVEVGSLSGDWPDSDKEFPTAKSD